MTAFTERVQELVAAREHQAATDLCNERINNDPWDTDAQDLVIGVILDFLNHTDAPCENRLRMASQSMQFGRRVTEVAKFYFSDLKRFLSQFPRREQPGALAIGLGPGRNGSTSLSALLASAPESFVTHEVRPMVHFPPTRAQILFHIRRFEMLRWHFDLVAETAHWMLYFRDHLLKKFPDIRFIVLERNQQEIVSSFERIKGRNNHWENHDGGHWNKTFWDVCYPKYGTDPNLSATGNRHNQIERYVSDYYKNCENIPPPNLLHLSLEDFQKDGGRIVGDFLGIELSQKPVHKNKGTTLESLDLQKLEF